MKRGIFTADDNNYQGMPKEYVFRNMAVFCPLDILLGYYVRKEAEQRCFSV